MQVVDSATTMGLLFGAMGVGAFIGPVGFNLFTPPKCALSGRPPTPGPAAGGPGACAEARSVHSVNQHPSFCLSGLDSCMAAPLLCLAGESLVAVERGLRQHPAYVMQSPCGRNGSVTRR